MRRFGQSAVLKPEMVEEYKRLHANVWEDVLKVIHECNIRNYSIYLKGCVLFSYYEYSGDNYEADMKKMSDSPVTRQWWMHTKPCFAEHLRQIYYEDMEEIFYNP